MLTLVHIVGSQLQECIRIRLKKELQKVFNNFHAHKKHAQLANFVHKKCCLYGILGQSKSVYARQKKLQILYNSNSN